MTKAIPRSGPSQRKENGFFYLVFLMFLFHPKTIILNVNFIMLDQLNGGIKKRFVTDKNMQNLRQYLG